jgi:hypothetical protein
MIQMPEAFIIKRWDAELHKNKLTDKWRTAYKILTESERTFVDGIVANDIFNHDDWATQSSRVKKVLDFHLTDRDDIPPADDRVKRQHIKIFEKSCPTRSTAECRKLLQTPIHGVY